MNRFVEQHTKNSSCTYKELSYDGYSMNMFTNFSADGGSAKRLRMGNFCSNICKFTINSNVCSFHILALSISSGGKKEI